jgi:hypothetical protein
MVAERVGTYIQEWVIGLSEAATSIYDIAHVLRNGFLGDIVFENDRVTCMRACMSWQRQQNLVCDMAYDYPYRRCQEPCGNAEMQTLGMVMVCEEEKLTPADLIR